MLKWLRDRNAPTQVAVIESLPVDGKRSVILVRRDNIEHLVMVGGRNDLVIEPNIMRRPAPNAARRPTPEWKELPPAPTREPLAEPPPKSLHHNLEELTRRLEAELRGSQPRRGQSSPPPREEARSSAQSDATSLDLEPRSKPRLDTRAEPKGEPKIQDEIQPEKSLDESTEPEDKEDVQH
jgi:flagellar protein FliO/FliZ